jgi:ribose/xylose/arabinose/galactoside ABC-type transport system permease subunit
MSKPLLWSFASSCIWIGVAISIAYAVSSIHTTPLDAAINFAGGIVASPAIGALIGYVARRFNKLTSGRRLLVALGDLYLATYLFLLSTGLDKSPHNLSEAVLSTCSDPSLSIRSSERCWV